MSPLVLLLIQSIAVTLQAINAALATTIKDPVISLVASAVIGGFQYFAQNAGNKLVPPPDPQAK